MSTPVRDFSRSLRVGRDLLEVGILQGADAAPLHLFVVALGFHVAHEDEALDRFDVRAGGDHVDGDGDTRKRIDAEGGDQLFRLLGGLAGNLLGEVVALAEDLTHRMHDFFTMIVVLGKDKRLWHPFPSTVGKQFGSLSLKQRRTARIWLGTVTSLSSCFWL